MKRKILAAATAGLLAALTLAAPASAITFETDYASGTGGSPGTADDCVEIYRAAQQLAGQVCFWSDGDILGVEDGWADGHSVALLWHNNYNGALYREGVCVESRGLFSRGTCNKNFHENSYLTIQACTWESSTGRRVDCGPSALLTT